MPDESARKGRQFHLAANNGLADATSSAISVRTGSRSSRPGSEPAR
jgi:hypothetical protein